MGEPSNVSTAAMNPCAGRQQYLVTYSQADESKFSTWESFGKMLEAEFNAGTGVAKLDYWACFRGSTRMMTFGIIARWSWQAENKWLSVKNKIAEKDGIQVNFREKHCFYLSAYNDVCKSDQELAHSEKNPLGLLTPASQKKGQLQNFVLPLPQKESLQKENLLVVLQRSEKV